MSRRGMLRVADQFATLGRDYVNLSQTSRLNSELPSGTGVHIPRSGHLADSPPLNGAHSRSWNTAGPSDGVWHSQTPCSGFSVTCSHVPADSSPLGSWLSLIPPSRTRSFHFKHPPLPFLVQFQPNLKRHLVHKSEPVRAHCRPRISVL